MIRSTLVLGLALAALAPVSALAAPATYGISFNGTGRASYVSGSKQLITETLRQAGHVVGHDKLTCTLKTPKILTCTAVITFDPTFSDGTIKAAGTVRRGGETWKLKITSGTGHYKNFKGSYSMSFESGTRTRTYATLDFINASP